MTDRAATIDAIETSLERLAGVDDPAAIDEGEREAILERLEAFADLLGEVDDLLEAIDFAALPDAIDAGQVLEAIELGELPDAIAEGETEDVVAVRDLVRAIELTKLWRAVDLGALWEAARDVEEAAGTVAGEEGESDDGVLGIDGLGDDGPLEGAGEAFKDELTGAVASLEPGSGDGIGLDPAQTAAYQTMIQQRAIGGIDAFREALLTTHGTFQAVYEENRERMRQKDKTTNSRNPTAVSTIPLERADVPSTARYATMPRTVRHSSAPTRKHIYGNRFERELEKRRESGSGSRSGSSARSGGER